MAKYAVWSIDAWADGEEGWTCNGQYFVKEVELPTAQEVTDEDVIDTLYEREVITTNDMEKFHIWDTCYEPLNMLVTNAETGEPLFEIRFEEE